MRTAKKTLCLVLAVAMMLSLCVFSASADVEFTDAEDIQFTEAAEVLATIGVIEGFPEGDFRPTENLTRAQGAAITARLMKWQEVPAITTFSDVPEWAHPYVAFCESNGIVAGYGDGTFGPDDELTGAQFAKMLLGALGYDPEAEKMQNVGTEWIVRVAQFARQNDLDDDIDNFPWNEVITREQAAQMALNAIKATMVEYTTGNSAIAGTANASYMTDTKAYATYIDDSYLSGSYAFTVELGEYYFKDLTLDRKTDDFMRDGDEWRFKGKKIGFYPDTPDLTYVVSAKVGTIYNDLGLSDKIDDDDVEYYINGKPAAKSYYWGVQNKAIPEIKRGGTDELGGNSVLLEVYYDDVAETVKIIEIHTYAAKVKTVKAETPTADAKITLEGIGGDNTGLTSFIDFDYDTDAFAKDEWLTYTYSEADGVDKVDRIKSVDKVEEVKGTMSTFKVGDQRDDGGYIKLGDTTYDKNHDSKIEDDDSLLGKEVTIYVDGCNNIVKASLEEKVNYVAIVGLARANQVNVDNAKARLFFDDATDKSAEITNSRKLANDVYYVDYDAVTIKAIADNPKNFVGYLTGDYADKKISLFDIVGYTGSGTEYKFKDDPDTWYDVAPYTLVEDDYITKYGVNTLTVNNYTYTINGDTKIMVMTVDDAGEAKYYVYEGVANVPDLKAIADGITYVTVKPVDDDSTTAKIVFIFAPEKWVDKKNDSDDIIFVKGGSGKKVYESGINFYQYDAIIDGEETTIKVDDPITKWSLITDLSIDEDGIYSWEYRVGDRADDSKLPINVVYGKKMAYYLGFDEYKKLTLRTKNNGTYIIDSDVDVYVWDTDDVLTVGGTELIDGDEYSEMWFVLDDKAPTSRVVKELYIRQHDGAQSTNNSGNSGNSSPTVSEDVYLTRKDTTIKLAIKGVEESTKYTFKVYYSTIGNGPVLVMEGDQSDFRVVENGVMVHEITTTSDANLSYYADVTVNGAVIRTKTISG